VTCDLPRGSRLLFSESAFRAEATRQRRGLQQLWEFCAFFSKKLTSASVLTELHCWIRETPPRGRAQLWQLVRDEFVSMGMEEDLGKLSEMDIDLLARLGPVDVSLLDLARLNAAQKPILVTTDGGLQAECMRVPSSPLFLLEVCLQGS